MHDIARYLEERRIEADGKLSSSDKRDNFILYETEHQKERYKRNRWQIYLAPITGGHTALSVTAHGPPAWRPSW